jgi:acyl dehydratase
MQGRCFEEFQVGEVARSPARTITEADITNFAAYSGDYNPLHTDAEFAGASRYGQRIAHGLLGLSVASGLTWRLGWIEGTALAFLDLEWKFRRPVFIGDTIHARMEVAELRSAPRMGGGIVTFDVRLLNQRDEVTQKGTWRLLIKGLDEAQSAASEAT